MYLSCANAFPLGILFPGITHSASPRHGKVMGSILGRIKSSTTSCSMFTPNYARAKDIKSCTNC